MKNFEVDWEMVAVAKAAAALCIFQLEFRSLLELR